MVLNVKYSLIQYTEPQENATIQLLQKWQLLGFNLTLNDDDWVWELPMALCGNIQGVPKLAL